MNANPRTTEDVFQDVLLALFQLHGQVLHAADTMSGEFELTGARWQVMKVVARQPMTASQIARRLGLQRQSVQRTVDSIRQQGLVEVRPNMDHVRAGLIALSDEGRRVLTALEQHQQAWLSRCMRGLTRSELEQVAGSLGELTSRVERATAREKDEKPARTRAPSGVRRRLVTA
jgi:DNA-binding MarR family transcriptional regulator